MKSIQSYILPLLVFAGAAGGVNAESTVTNIDPALTYFQAFIVAPDLPSEDRDYLFTNDWQGQLATERFGNLLKQYDNEFKLIRAASQSSALCEWGIDYSAGPQTLLAYLPRIKSAAVVARLRAALDLQNGRETDGRDDLLAILKLARNGASDGSLIGALVQIAVERIICESVAENFNHISPEVLQQLSDGLSAPPPRQTIAGCIPMEQNLCERWMIDRTLELQAQYPGNDMKVLQGLHHYFEYFLADTSNNDGSKDETTPKIVFQIMTAAHGTSDGVIKLFREMDPVYSELATIEALPFAQYNERINQFTKEMNSSDNPFVLKYIPAVLKCRPREFCALADIAMVQAAVQYKLHGDAGLQTVANPCGQGPFAVRRFEFEGVDRGFELDSGYSGNGYPEVFIFVEKDGAPFQVFGKSAGKTP